MFWLCHVHNKSLRMGILNRRRYVLIADRAKNQVTFFRGHVMGKNVGNVN